MIKILRVSIGVQSTTRVGQEDWEPAAARRDEPTASDLEELLEYALGKLPDKPQYVTLAIMYEGANGARAESGDIPFMNADSFGLTELYGEVKAKVASALI